MKVNLKKFGALVAGATLLASSAAFAAVSFGTTTLVDSSGNAVAKVAMGGDAHPSDGVAAALIAGTIAANSYKSETLTASVSGSATCSGDGSNGSAGTCSISDEKARLEITVPGSVAAGTWTGENLIGDFMNRELLDREDNVAGDSDSEYEMGGSDTSENANPFTDGAGGDLGVSETFLYNIDGGAFSTFADMTLTDSDSGNTYVEMQNMWLVAENRFDEDPDDVVGDLDFLAYTLKFDGPGGDELGIPVCTDSEDNDFTYCKGVDGDIDDATETHRLKVYFLGEEWIISEMTAPVDTLLNENVLVNGGSVKLAKESVGGILNQGEFLQVDDLKFQLDDLEAHGDTTSAIISVLDANDNVLEKDKVDPGDTKEMMVNGKEYRFHVYKVAPGYTFGAKWADVAIFSHEIECEDGQELDSDENTNPSYECALGWKNMDAAPDPGGLDGDPETPDTLRTIIVFSDDIEDISSSGEEELEPGDYVTIVEEPASWKLSYKGLDLTSEDRFNLKFELKTSDKDISASKGPYTSCSGDPGVGDVDSTVPTTCDSGDPVQAKCTIYAPYIEVSSGDTGSVFEVDRSDVAGDLSDDEFYIGLCVDGTGTACNPDVSAGPFEAIVCDGNNDGLLDGAGTGSFVSYFSAWPGGLAGTEYDFGLTVGTVMMRTSASSDNYGFLDYFDTAFFGTFPDNKGGLVGTEVRYEDIGDGDDSFAPPDGGAILIQDGAPIFAGPFVTDEQMGDLLYSAGFAGWGTPEVPDFHFAVAEKAGTGSSNEYVDYFMFGVDDIDSGTPGDATFDFESGDGAGFDVTSDNEEILYGHATPNPPDVMNMQFYCTAGPCVFDGIPTGPVSPGVEMVEEGYISERGSVFELIDDNTVEFDMAHKLARAQWWLGPSETASASDSSTIVTLGEGESTTVSGVTVKVLEITETVGACSAAGGAVSCTADMSGVSAVIMPNNAASVDAVTYTSPGNLVVLDSDATGLSTVVSVGGDAVNSLSESWLATSPVDWTAQPKVVKEMEQGKILVAGADKEKTLEAAKDFVAQLQMS